MFMFNISFSESRAVIGIMWKI